eukprot:CAMPEP_0176230926 /NCGR_PEP_ID=MMETSP0121_2-20121125/24542_1 /TAXON_ID=160619 /ORGANISM="Kryptoperidinium foliaceum, Strain CCMP 1326" /LENGTH=545 /DNA_ID=CAMNT_0017570267 /DNA_START=260 /DNA_END=1893 /DNA_ORIENTATION=-
MSMGMMENSMMLAPPISQRLDELLSARLQEVIMTKDDFQVARSCLRELQTLVGELGSGWRVKPFGSLCNGYAIQGSDLDVACIREGEDDGFPTALQMLEQVLPLFQARDKFKVVDAIKAAMVPILKINFQQVLDVDLSFKNTGPLPNTQLLRAYSELDTHVRELVVMVKLWAKAAGVCGAANGHLSAYSFTLMAIYFLQVDPPVADAMPQHRAVHRRGELAEGGQGASLEVHAPELSAPLQVLLLLRAGVPLGQRGRLDPRRREIRRDGPPLRGAQGPDGGEAAHRGPLPAQPEPPLRAPHGERVRALLQDRGGHAGDVPRGGARGPRAPEAADPAADAARSEGGAPEDRHGRPRRLPAAALHPPHLCAAAAGATPSGSASRRWQRARARRGTDDEVAAEVVLLGARVRAPSHGVLRVARPRELSRSGGRSSGWHPTGEQTVVVGAGRHPAGRAIGSPSGDGQTEITYACAVFSPFLTPGVLFPARSCTEWARLDFFGRGAGEGARLPNGARGSNRALTILGLRAPPRGQLQRSASREIERGECR